MFGKKKGTLTLNDLFSDDVIQYSLESLSYEKFIRGDRPFEMISLGKIPRGARVFYRSLLQQRETFGEWIYNIQGNRIERFNPSIKPVKTDKPKYSISKPYKRFYDLEKLKSVGLVGKL